jgi:hypothetical protein
METNASADMPSKERLQRLHDAAAPQLTNPQRGHLILFMVFAPGAQARINEITAARFSLYQAERERARNVGGERAGIYSEIESAGHLRP